VTGDTLEFTISSLITQPFGADPIMPHRILFLPVPFKHILITPTLNFTNLDASITVDGEISVNRFFPFGNKVLNITGNVTVRIDEFTMIPILPMRGEAVPDSLILWGTHGNQISQPSANPDPAMELDPETLEQLRSLGYLN
jgi:hypothetical protein